MVRGLLLSGLLAGASAWAAPTNAQALVLDVPDGWKRTDVQHMVLFHLQEKGTFPVVAVLPAEPLNESFDAWFARAWKDQLRQMQGPEEKQGNISSGGDFEQKIVAASMVDPTGRTLYVTFWAAGRKGGVAQPVLFVSDRAESYNDNAEKVERMLGTVKLATGSVPPPKAHPTLLHVITYCTPRLGKAKAGK